MNSTHLSFFFLQLYKFDFIIYIIKEVEAHEYRSYWTLLKNSEVNNKYKNKYGKLKTILSSWYITRKRSPDGKLNKHKNRLCEHIGIQQLVVNYW